MLKDFIVETVNQGRIRWQRHALERMMERNIFRTDVKQVLVKGELIEEHPDDSPFPSGLFLGYINDKPLHVVVGGDKENKWCYVVTAYHPDLEHFEPDFKTRKK
ncbi:protein of unknown function [Fodinibius roseus]|uniref:DUF4258 domain-containing protein n=1 Tax=Fodinibius roseus TaxID=1194090 RepID=A0A1M5IZN0_9BACT|nr:DUF4258 domain-containing protein [Fodinibius roseus]SHG33575.1 protein of unknown function [Fodinibius roseus]